MVNFLNSNVMKFLEGKAAALNSRFNSSLNQSNKYKIQFYFKYSTLLNLIPASGNLIFIHSSVILDVYYVSSTIPSEGERKTVVLFEMKTEELLPYSLGNRTPSLAVLDLHWSTVST